MTRSVDARIARVAAAQHGIVHTSQLRRIGVSRDQVLRRHRRGLLHRVHPGVYAVGHPRLSRHQQRVAALLACGRGAHVGGIDAAVMWSMWRRRVAAHEPVTVIVPHRCRPRSGVRVVESVGMRDEDGQVLDGIAVTSPARTLLDLADQLRPMTLAEVISEAEYRNVFDIAACEELMDRNRGRTRACARLWRGIELHLGERGAPRSWLEEQVICALQHQGISVPHVNYPMFVGGRRYVLDLWWPDPKICVEVDGPIHDVPSRQLSDLERQSRLEAVGIRVARVSWRRIEADVGAVVAQYAEALHGSSAQMR